MAKNELSEKKVGESKGKKGDVKKDNTNYNIESYSIIDTVELTEKSYRLSQSGQYVFRIKKDANKLSVKRAVEVMYKVKVDKVNIIKVKPERTFVKGRRGMTKGYKKAIVVLEKGQSINI
jgi:large subunit ribosomal protein L23